MWLASTESWETLSAIDAQDAWEFEGERRGRLLQGAPASAQDETVAELVLAADQFIIAPARTSGAWVGEGGLHHFSGEPRSGLEFIVTDCYGGHGIFEPEDPDHGWTIPGGAAILLGPQRREAVEGQARLRRRDARRVRESAA